MSLGYIFIDNPEDHSRLSKMLVPVAKRFKGEVLFGTVSRGRRWPSVADLFWFQTVTDWPSFTIREPVKNLRYPFDPQEELSEGKLDNFIEAFVNKKLKPTIKSEPIPKGKRTPVLDVVALTYDEIVMEEGKTFCSSSVLYGAQAAN